MSRKSGLQIDDTIIDEIVDEILEEGSPRKLDKTSDARLQSINKNYKSSGISESLEKKFEDHLKNYQTTVMELERQITEKSEGWANEHENQLMRLQSQIEDLRTAMIRLSSELKKVKDSLPK